MNIIDVVILLAQFSTMGTYTSMPINDAVDEQIPEPSPAHEPYLDSVADSDNDGADSTSSDSGTDNTDSTDSTTSYAIDTVDDVDILTHVCKAIRSQHAYTSQHLRYFVKMQPHMDWDEFTDLLGRPDWADCSQCAKTWNQVSVLAGSHGQPVIFRAALDSYPTYTHNAIRAFRASFSKATATGHIINGVPPNGDQQSQTFGRRCLSGHVHLNLATDLRPGDWFVPNISSVISQVVQSLVCRDKLWTPEALEVAKLAYYPEYSIFLRSFSSEMLHYRQNMDAAEAQRLLPLHLAVCLVNILPRQARDGSTLCQGFREAYMEIFSEYRKYSQHIPSARETIMYDLLIDGSPDDVNDYEWPKTSTLEERIVAMAILRARGLREAITSSPSQAVQADCAAELAYRLLGLPLASMPSTAVGKEMAALRHYLLNSPKEWPISVGTGNYRRWRLLYYCMLNKLENCPRMTALETMWLINDADTFHLDEIDTDAASALLDIRVDPTISTAGRIADIVTEFVTRT